MRRLRILAAAFSLAAVASLLVGGVIVVQRPHLTGGVGNSAPTITVPGAQDTPWLATETFSGGTAISIADTDGDAQEVGLVVSHGLLTLDGTTGLGFSVGDGTSDAALTFTGSITNINNALSGMVYTPTAGFAGHSSLPMTFPPDELEIETDDGAGGSDSDSVVINVVSGGEVLKITADIGTVFQTVSGAAAGTGDPVGEAQDQSGEGNDATQGTAGSRPTLSSDVSAALGGAGGNRRSLSFDGSDDGLETSVQTAAATYTVECFIRPKTQVSAYGVIIANAGATAGVYYLGSDSGAEARKIDFYFGSNNKTTIALTDDAWQHYALSVSAGSFTHYLNAVARGTGTGAPDITFTRIGSDGTLVLKAIVDEKIVYGFALSATQVEYRNAGGP